MVIRNILLGAALSTVFVVGCSASSAGDPETSASAESGLQGPDSADPSATVLLLHGFHSHLNGRGWDCKSFWKTQNAHLQRAGFNGPVRTVGYYSKNTNCDRNADDPAFTKDGDVTLEQGDAGNTLNPATPIEHAAYRVAWVVASEHAANPQHSVRMIADSLGGNVVRWLVMQASAKNPNYPSLTQLGLTRVYAYGAPYGGTTLASLGPWPQAQQMMPGSPFTSEMQESRSVGSAKWFNFTSSRTTMKNQLTQPGDGFISNDSACFEGSTCLRYEAPKYIHGTYALDTEEVDKADAYRVRNPDGSWGPLAKAPAAGALVARSLASNAEITIP